MPNIVAEIEMTQERRGLEYKGGIILDKLYAFQYSLKCSQNIEELDALAKNNLDAALDLTKIRLQYIGEESELSIPEELVPLFQSIIIPLAVELHHMPINHELDSLNNKLASFGTKCESKVSRSMEFEGDKMTSLLAQYFQQ